MCQGPYDFGQHSRLEDGTAHGARGGMFRILEAGQIAERAHIGEVDLGRLHQTLANIRKVWTHDDHLVGGFEYGQPCLGRIDCHSKVAGDIGQVEELGASCGQHAQEVLILGQVGDLPQSAYIPLEIGLDVAGLPEEDIAIGLDRKFRVATSDEALPKFTESMGTPGRRNALVFPGKGSVWPPLGFPP